MADTPQIIAMRKLGWTDEEIAEVLADDRKIDKGEKLFELTDEQKKVAKKMSNADHKKKAPTVYNFDTPKKARKENPTKAGIIAKIYEFLAENSGFEFENVEIVSKERQIAIVFEGNNYELTLSQKRKPK